MAEEGMVYIDLKDLNHNLFRIFHLRERLGVRSFANTVARLLNPLQCGRQLNGLFHTPFAQHMAQANVLLGQQKSLIFMGAEGEPELYADRQKLVKQQLGEVITDVDFRDCGFEIYPKQPVQDLQQLHHDFQRMLTGDRTDREQAVITRMKEAFED